MATATQPQPITAAMAPEDLERFYEVVDGRVVENPPMGAYETSVANSLMASIFLSDRPLGPGRVNCEMLYALTPGLQRRPDVSFVSYDRWPKDREVSGDEAWDVVPDLVVEVISPSITFRHVMAKIREYFRAGVRMVWVIAPRDRIVQIYGSPEDVRGVPPGGDLDGGAVLPGSRLPLAELITEAARTD